MKYLYLVLLLICTQTVFSQSDKIVKGRIFNESNKEALIGVNIVEAGTTNGVVSDVNGFFEIKTSKDTLIISYTGMNTYKLALTNKDFYEVSITENALLLQELVVSFENVNVLSRRRSENIQKIPESVTAFTRKDIERAGLNKISNVIAFTPNVTFINSQNQGNIALTLRGISQVRNGDAPIAFVVDGVTMPSPNSINQDLFDIERIEITKGPQGALYGRNAIGGAINIITRKPTNTPEHSIKVGYGNGNYFSTKFNSSGKLIKDKLFYRVAAAYNKGDGLIKDTLQRLVDFQENFYARTHLTANLSEKLDLDVTASYGYTNGGAIYWARLYNDGDANNYSTKITSDILGGNTRKLADASLKLRYNFSKAGSLEYVGAFSYVDEVFFGDLDLSPLSFIAQRQILNNKAVIQEIRFTSLSDKKFRYLFGAFFNHNQRRLTSIGTADAENPLSKVVFGIPAGTGYKVFLERAEENQNTSLAGFAQINWDILPKLELSMAMRWDTDIRQQQNLADNVIRKATFDKWQPKVSLAYKMNKDILLYANIAQGYRSGGFNAPGIKSFPAQFDSEYSTNTEIGLKSAWFNNRLILNLAAFSIDFQNQQLFIVDALTVAQGIINIEKTLNQGFEAELKIKPVPQLDLLFGYGFTDAKIQRVASADQKQFEGNFSPLTVANTFSFAAQFTQIINQNEFVFRLTTERRGKLYWHLDNKDFQNPVQLFGARTSWTKGKYSMTVWAENLLNTQYNVEFLAKEFTGAGADLRWTSKPRSFGIELGYRF